MAAPIWKLREIVVQREEAARIVSKGKGSLAAANRLKIARDNLNNREKEIAAELAAETATKKSLATTTAPLGQSKPTPTSLPGSELILPSQSSLSLGNQDHEDRTGTVQSHDVEDPLPAQGDKNGSEATKYKSWFDLYFGQMKCTMDQISHHLDGYTSFKPAHQIVGSGACTDDDVVFSIASLLVGLKEDTPLAFGTSPLYQMSRYGAGHGKAPILRNGDFLMPLAFHSQMRELEPEEPDSIPSQGPAKRRKMASRTPNLDNWLKKSNKSDKVGQENWIGGIGHFMSAVAERLDNNNVKLLFMDSLPDYIPKGIIRRTARNIVRYSDWMTDEPSFVSEDWLSVIRQQGENTCGLHTIFNAWAYALKIELKDTAELTTEFYDQARRFINLCLMGSVDMIGVKAFFHQFGLAMGKSPAIVDQSSKPKSYPEALYDLFTETINRSINCPRLVTSSQGANREGKETSQYCTGLDQHPVMGEFSLGASPCVCAQP
ncbi:hypothetical protein MMC22_009278 [Lobaria immixta]|nr:hypothetical protein [Lobaria immixta]